ncbi:MAG: hypothetical protein K2X47_00575 [Bdellovibrionales bacterium]|nr:hypothetical protein [Bdellovibrionales bacterium]
MKTVISASVIWSLVAATGLAQTLSPQERIHELDLERSRRQSEAQKEKERRAEAEAKAEAQALSESNQLGYRVFDKGELGQVRVSYKCYLDGQDPDPKNREACETVMRAYANDPAPEIIGGIEVPTGELRGKVSADGTLKTEAGTLRYPDFSKFDINSPLGEFGSLKSEESSKVERIAQKSSLLVTVQKVIGETESKFKKVWNGLNPDLQFFGIYAERADGHTSPFMAAAIQFRKEAKLKFLEEVGVKKVHITVLMNPFNVLAIPQIRKAVKNSDEYNSQIEEAAIHHISAATGIPVDKVHKLVPQSTIDAAIAQGHALADAELNQRVSYANGLRTMVQEAYATFYFTENTDSSGKVLSGKTNWTARIGKISPNQQRSLLDSSTNLMFASSYQASVRMSRRTFAVTTTVSSMLGPQESPLGGLVEAYIRAMIAQGADYFSIRPNAVDVNLELKSDWFEARAIPIITGAMAGFGAVSGQPFTYLRVDGSKGPVSGSYMAYWQTCKSGSETWLGCQENREVQKRQYGTISIELEHFKNRVAKFVHSKIFGEVKGEFYRLSGGSPKNGSEDFTLRAVTIGKTLPKVMQKPFGYVGAQAAFEFRVANVSIAGTHGEHGANHNIYGVGIVFTRKPKKTDE